MSDTTVKPVEKFLASPVWPYDYPEWQRLTPPSDTDVTYVDLQVADLFTQAGIDAPAPPRKCETCRWWVHRYADMGECMLPWGLGSKVRIEIDGGNELPSLLTPATHHCAGWEPRDAPGGDGRGT